MSQADHAPTIHPSATVDAGASIGRGAHIWHYCHIMHGAKIGHHSSLGQGCFVANGAVIGSRVKIQNNVSVYSGVVLENDVFVGPSAVFTNVLNPRSEIDRRSEYLPTIVQKGATIGANATILPGVIVGEYAFIGAGAVVTRDVCPYALVVGAPARQMGWMSRTGHRLHFDARGSSASCPAGERYQLVDGSCVLLSARQMTT